MSPLTKSLIEELEHAPESEHLPLRTLERRAAV